MNEAVARHLVFGQDIIFTFGPLASVYTGMYHPATDWIMLFGRGLVGAGLSFGCTLLVWPKKYLQALLLPFLVAETVSMDAIGILLPFVLLLLVLRVCVSADSDHYLRASHVVRVTIGIVTCSVALLPLVKGSFVATAFFSLGLAFLILLRRRPSAAVAFMGLLIVTVSGAWVAVGQPIAALPKFFFAQGPIISGYSEAMSYDGPPEQPIIYVAVSLVVLFLFYQRFARTLGWTGFFAVASLAFALLVCFKAGFVRHPFIATGVLSLAGYCASALIETVPSLIVWISVVFTLVCMDPSHIGLDAVLVSQRLVRAVTETVYEIKMRSSFSQDLRTVFNERNAAIRKLLPLPPTGGTVDLYPFELSTVFAHGLRWSPRPIIQSYVAYDGRLDALNVSHLESVNAPQDIFFQVQPIDNRLPALEDAGSWLVLLSRYKMTSCDSLKIHLERSEGDPFRASLPAQVSRLTAQLGSPVKIPSINGPIWTEINLAPSFLGDLGLSLFKLPPVQITLALEDGHVVHCRYIPAMGQKGFLLSPFIQTTDEFALLHAGIDSGNKVRSFQIETPAVWGWHRDFSVSFRQLEIQGQPDERRIVATQSSEPPPAITHPVRNSKSVFYIDFVNNFPAPADKHPISAQGTLKLEGWCVVSGNEGIAPEHVWIALTQSDGKCCYYQAIQEPRPDVNAYFRHPKMKDPGFAIRIDLTGLHGSLDLNILQENGDTAYDCSVHRTVNVISRSP